MWDITQLALPGALLIKMPVFTDNRGRFVKTFQTAPFASANVAFELKESYFSVSAKDVIRGMHFQLPPHQHSKIVFCPQGAILDVIIDLRKDMPTYGEYCARELSENNNLAYYIPEGFAHGFKSLTDNAITYYLVSSEYSQAHDTGIRYDSFGYDWQTESPTMSSRDLGFQSLQDFNSPF